MSFAYGFANEVGGPQVDPVLPGRAGRVVLDRSLCFWVGIREPGMMGPRGWSGGA